MPYPNEHSARLKEPSSFSPKTFRRVNDGTIYGKIKVPQTVAVIWGKLKGKDKPSDNPVPQALRFPTKNWTAEKAKKWLKDNNVKYIRFEPASDEKDKDNSSEAVAVNVQSVLAQMQNQKWAMEANALQHLFHSIANQQSYLPDSVEIQIKKPTLRISGKNAVIPIKGVLLREIPKAFIYWGIEGTSYNTIAAQIKEALSNDKVESILLDVDSPGGAVPGVLETADLIRQAREQKPVRAFVDDLCASAAYWLSSQANEIESVPNGENGSIGVFTVYIDSAKRAEDLGFKVHLIRSGEHKGMGVPGVEITEEQIEAVQEIVDGIADNFIASVAAGRGVKKTTVSNWADGRLWLADEAAKMGLIDNVIKSIVIVKEQNMKTEEIDSQITENEKEGLSEQERQQASQKAIEAERQRIKQLNTEFADDPEFAMKAAGEGWNVEQAKAEYVTVLREKLKEKKVKPNEQNQAQGSAPLSSDDTDTGSGEDFLEQAKAMAKEKNISVTAAMKKLRRAKPELHQAYLQKCGESGKQMYQEAV